MKKLKVLCSPSKHVNQLVNTDRRLHLIQNNSLNSLFDEAAHLIKEGCLNFGELATSDMHLMLKHNNFNSDLCSNAPIYCVLLDIVESSTEVTYLFSSLLGFTSLLKKGISLRISTVLDYRGWFYPCSSLRMENSQIIMKEA